MAAGSSVNADTVLVHGLRAVTCEESLEILCCVEEIWILKLKDKEVRVARTNKVNRTAVMLDRCHWKAVIKNRPFFGIYSWVATFSAYRDWHFDS